MAYDKSRLITLSDYGFSKDVIDDINSRLNTKVTDIQDRLDIVNKIISDYAQEFLNLNDKNISNLNKSDSLSEDAKLVKFLDRFANYLDNSDDAKRDKLSQRRGDSHEVCYDLELLQDIEETKKSYYKSKEQQIFKADFDNEAYGAVLRDYQIVIDYLSEKLRTLREECKLLEFKSEEYKHKNKTIRKIMSMIGDYRADQIETKNGIGRLIEFKKLTPNTSANDWFSFVDYGKSEDIKICLVNCAGNMLTEKGTVAYDLNELIDKCGFTQEELDILKHYRAGQTQNVIADELEKDQSTISSKIDTMCNRISKQHLADRYDNIRLNYIRGSYKRCNTCNKILFEKDFYKNQCVCKSCHIKNVKSKQ
jgi:hypothetical protein